MQARTCACTGAGRFACSMEPSTQPWRGAAAGASSALLSQTHLACMLATLMHTRQRWLHTLGARGTCSDAALQPPCPFPTHPLLVTAPLLPWRPPLLLLLLVAVALVLPLCPVSLIAAPWPLLEPVLLEPALPELGGLHRPVIHQMEVLLLQDVEQGCWGSALPAPK